MKFKTSLLCGSIIVTMMFVIMAGFYYYNRISYDMTISLDPFKNLAKNYSVLAGMDWHYTIIDTSSTNQDEIPGEKIALERTLSQKNKNAVTSQAKRQVIPPYKSVIENVKINISENSDEIVIRSSGIDKSNDEISVAATLYDGQGEINNSEIVIDKNSHFDIPESLDIKSIQEKLVSVFEGLKQIEMAKSDLAKPKDEIDPPVVAINEMVHDQENKKPDEPKIQSSEKISDQVTTQASKNQLRPQIAGDFETIEDVKDIKKDNNSNEYSKNEINPKTKGQPTPEKNEVLISNEDPEIDDAIAFSEKSKEMDLQQDDDLYVLDYSKNNGPAQLEKVVTSQNVSKTGAVSSNVKSVIGLEERKEAAPQENQGGDEPILAYNFKDANAGKRNDQPTAVVKDRDKNEENKNINQEADDLQKGNETKIFDNKENNRGANLTLKVRDARFSKGLRGHLNNFELITSHNHQDSFYDENEGKIEIVKELNSDKTILSGTIVKSDYMRTRVDLLLERDDFEVEIPLFHINNFANFLDKNNANVPGSFILVELNESIEDVQLENETEKYFFLNNKLDVVERADAMYLLIAGVEPGNVLIKYLVNDQIAQRIIYVDENELYFDNAEFTRGELDTFDFFEEGLLSKKEKPLDIPDTQIKYFNFPSVAQRESLLTYSIKTPFLVTGNRKYLEFNHQHSPIYLGYNEASKQIIPSQELIDHVVSSFGLSDLENSCLLQINLNNHPAEIFYSGHSAVGQLGLEVKYLDREGNLSMDIAETAEKIFINGDRPGTINLEIKYVDGTVDYLQSVCANKAYIIEQL